MRPHTETYTVCPARMYNASNEHVVAEEESHCEGTGAATQPYE